MTSHTKTDSKGHHRSLDHGETSDRTRHSPVVAGNHSPEELVARRRRLERRRRALELENANLRHSEQTLRRRVEFGELLFDLSRTFIGLTEEEVDVNMERGLARVGEFLEMDRVTLLELSRDRREMAATYSWSLQGVPPAPAVITKGAQPWWVGQVLSGEVSLASHVEDLPEEAAAEKEYLRQRGIASAASIPLRVSGEIAGVISFVTLHRHVTWTEELVNELRAVGDILWNALKRRRSTQALRAAQDFLHDSEERFRLAMNNVAAGLYTVDLNGLVTYVNPAAEAILGWTTAELLGRKMHDMTHYKHPDGTLFPASECPGLNVLQKGIELREHEDTFIRKDGSFVPVVFSASPLKKDQMTVGIVVGFRDDTARREAERAVRESEERFRLMANAAPVLIWMSDVDKRCTYFNQGWLKFTGRSLEAELGHGWTEGVHPDDFEKCLDTSTKAFDRREPFQMEYRLRRADGEYRWIYDHGVPRFKEDHSFAGYIGSCIDVTESKQVAEALSTVNQRLIQAHEEERTHLARELHDDIVQRLALLSVNLQLVKRAPLPAEADRKIAKAIQGVADLTTDLQTLSHRLHSSKLEFLGLARAAAGFCAEVSDQQGVEIDFHADNIAKTLPTEISLCLFRVLQEALQNAIKHSGSHSFEVALRGHVNAVELMVKDSGSGFDLQQSIKGRGLGLTSMKERLALVHGQLSIHSELGRGTTVQARVPLTPQSSQEDKPT